jgi:hypothetical protein
MSTLELKAAWYAEYLVSAVALKRDIMRTFSDLQPPTGGQSCPPVEPLVVPEEERVVGLPVEPEERVEGSVLLDGHMGLVKEEGEGRGGGGGRYVPAPSPLYISYSGGA